MSNIFINYFTATAKKTKSNIKFLLNHYKDYLSNKNKSANTIFLTPTDKKELPFISFLDSHKSSGPNCTLMKIKNSYKNDIFQQ